MEDILFEEKELAEITLKSIGDGVITTDSLGRVASLNPVAETLIGWKSAEVKGSFLSDLFEIRDEMTGERLENPVERVLRECRSVRPEGATLLVTRDGRELAVSDDEVLRQLSVLFGKPVRETDTLARLGGDEFALLLYHCPLARAREIAGAILTGLRDFQFVRDAKTFKFGASIGIVAFHPSMANPETALEVADAACYAAKKAGGDRYHIYRPAPTLAPNDGR